MKIYYPSDQNFTIAECVATVGFFDGVHAGHRFLIHEMISLAKLKKRPSVVFTFAVHPRKVLHSDFQPALLTTLDEKLVQLQTTGIDACVVLDFSVGMSKLTAYEFLKTILFDQYNVRTLLVGHDHRFGHNRAEGFADYLRYGAEMGLEIIQAKRYATTEFNHISSSEVRLALQGGDIVNANQLLSYKYSFVGEVIDGFKVGRKIGFPTANVEPEDVEKLIPAIGVYAVEVNWNDTNYIGMMNIGIRPTMANGNKTSLEVNIFDFDENIYHEKLRISFVQKIREELKFNSIDELIEQLKRDKQTVLEVLG